MAKNQTYLFIAGAVGVAVVGLAMGTAMTVFGAKKAEKPVVRSVCTTIQSGKLTDTTGRTIALGYDQWGYNYQAHMYEGLDTNASRPATVSTTGDRLMMKWNDAWLSNESCDGNTTLDRHRGYPSYVGSGAWLTNTAQGTYKGDKGKTCKWNDFVKIVAVPSDATQSNGTWYDASGKAIGPVIWGQFALIQEVSSDPCGKAGMGLSHFRSELRSGLGNW